MALAVPTIATTDTLAAALDYAQRGWPVFPAYNLTATGACTCGPTPCGSPGKHPRTAHGLSDATTDEAQIRLWWQRWPFANIAIRTGTVSGIVVIDIDPRNGGDETLATLQLAHGRLPDTAESLTGGGGRHLLFQHPGGEVRSRSGALGPGVDVKADGGYIIAPPSRHVSGRGYEWESSSNPADVPLALLPDWLRALVVEDVDVRATSGAAPPVPEILSEGQRHEALVSLAGTMRRRGMTEAALAAALLVENTARCRPPLAEGEVRGIAASIAKYPPAAAKNANRSATAKNVNHSPSRSSLENGAAGGKGVTESVTLPAGILSALEDVPWAQLGCRLGSEVVPENVQWLWQGRLAQGKLNLIEGDGGEGKSMILDDLAARLSANLPLPDGSANPFGVPVKVVLLMAEDDAADTIIPRILAAGGDPANIIILDTIPDEDGGHFPTIPDDLDHIEHVVTAAAARALVIDPLVSYLSAEVNSHNDHSVRRALAPLPGLAARCGCAVVAVRHLNKNTTADPKHRGSGAGAFINLARVGLAIGADPDDASGARRILAVNKVNIATQAGALAFHIETAWVRKDESDVELIKTARVVWDGPSTLTAADILGAKPDEETRSASEIAKDLLMELLSADPQDEPPVWEAIKKAGVSHSSYMRARKALGVRSSRVGGLGNEGKWQLSLPAKLAPTKSATAPSAATPADGRGILKQTDPVPDGEPLPSPSKDANGMGDIHSGVLSGPRPSGPCEQDGCTRSGNALDAGRWLCFAHHPQGTAAPTRAA